MPDPVAPDHGSAPDSATVTDASTLVTDAVAAAGATVLEAREVSKGYSWPECPRWHDGALWFSDMYTATLKRLDSVGNATVVVDASTRATDAGVPIVLGGFGWLPDGRLIVVSMHEKLLLVQGDAGPTDLSVYADLSAFCPAPVNDMVLDTDGRAYITQFGFNFFKREPLAAAPLIVVAPDGSVSTADQVRPLMCANGIAISADGTRVYTAEVLTETIIVIDRAVDGTLSNPREFAKCPFRPDGIGLDEEGGVWAAMLEGGHVARFTGDGLTHAVPISPRHGMPSACLLGGPDRTTLFITVGHESFDFDKSAREAQGSIWMTEVPQSGGTTRP
ncbi:SMP-30/gluconolactonase/LRE family protein [Rhodococcus pyridinivorans]|uniref:SMP-30/gluconolactonase/LRE family protein n=1 Tax=Rhodococcus pyridinivorans TaxID=103816 RepID=UPI0009BCA69E|nr:SMP-30/gluconolactonase/LRE family protein [Rhodococcus pyridinivorans]